MSVDGRVVVVAGATSSSGVATARALISAGARVVAVGSNVERLSAFERSVAGAATRVCDLSRLTAVTELAGSVAQEFGAVDGLVHLVGGWRGSAGITAQSDDDWAAMDAGFTTLRNTSRAFFDSLVASEAGRLAIVSSNAVERPTAGGASYTAAKAAAESWVRSVADGFRRAQSGKKADPVPQRAAAVRLSVMALVDGDMRRDNPEKTFAGFTDVDALGQAVVGLWQGDAAELNDSRIPLG
ncbi:NADP-dependent 3-hydroxy acid dehydrogenase YdfG [Agreia bicolorata]|uniref:NADP-dependent 3-hydroxy acid dehydrogenase YdfG n=1 Tax=Agreia bicolorata TaxID=110935 RepID=A0A1T4XIT1_9MICO|nr:SDR family NAD(P)-dependent oxidoreductase [Agreia bicolorata]SKA89001.1 NADP-dependent 3-hydroxy acid dehydrogenase YdfG [Agreia bicolorata]